MVDQVIVLSYLGISLLIGLLSGRNTISLEDYAIGKRNFSNFALAAGIAATQISASGTSGLIGKIYVTGLISVLSYFGVVASRMLVVVLVAPRMKKFLGLISSGDIFENLYGKNAKIMMGVLILIEGPLLAGAQVLATYQAIHIFFNVSKEIAAISTTLVIVAYCFKGGIRSVNATDVFQFLMIIVAIPIIATFAIDKIGGFYQFTAILNEKQLLLDSVTNGDQVKHLTIFISIAVTCIFPLTIQRMLMAKDVNQIKKAFFINGLISLFFYIAIGIIGLSSAILLPNINPNFALPTIINEILPLGVRGLVVAGLIAIFMSSADSDMNVTAVALTQDLLKPIFGRKLTGQMAFTITRLSFVFTGVFAVVVALYYSNALDVLFVIMTIANSIYFPGMIFGIIGLVPPKQGFWIGASTGAVIAAIMCWGYHVFPLYAMMTAIMANSCVVLVSYFLVRVSKANFIKMFRVNWRSFRRNGNSFFEFKKSNYLVSVSSYCDVFAMIVLINSMAPFFLRTFYLNVYPAMMIALNVAGSVLGVLLLLRQTFSSSFKQLMPVLWQLTVFLSLTLKGAIYIVLGSLHLVLVFDLITMFSLLILLLERRELFLHAMFFLICSVGLRLSNTPTAVVPLDIQYWSIFLHAIALVLCLILFRKREVAAYKFMSLKFVHEAGRTISSVSTASSLLQQWLPKLVENYRLNQPNSSGSERINEIELSQLLDIPRKLSRTSIRTWENLNHLTAWMEIQKHKSEFSLHSIKQCLQLALDDASLPDSLKTKITIKNTPDFMFYGDLSQVSNVILNVLENASHAIKDLPNSSIIIWTDKNRLIVRDSGVGISKKHLPNIFDDFFSTKGTSGQGLAFCKLVMQRHDGNISCESELGKHAQFTITFPSITRTQEISQ